MSYYDEPKGSRSPLQSNLCRFCRDKAMWVLPWKVITLDRGMLFKSIIAQTHRDQYMDLNFFFKVLKQ